VREQGIGVRKPGVSGGVLGIFGDGLFKEFQRFAKTGIGTLAAVISAL
jgi:hypothetical protein